MQNSTLQESVCTLFLSANNILRSSLSEIGFSFYLMCSHTNLIVWWSMQTNPINLLHRITGPADVVLLYFHAHYAQSAEPDANCQLFKNKRGKLRRSFKPRESPFASLSFSACCLSSSANSCPSLPHLLLPRCLNKEYLTVTHECSTSENLLRRPHKAPFPALERDLSHHNVYWWRLLVSYEERCNCIEAFM